MTARSRLVPAAVLVALAAPSAALADDARIDFRSNAYVPQDVRIKPGERVTWMPQTGESFDAHPLSSEPGESETYSRSSGTQPYSRVFAATGRYRFHCTFHGGPEGLGMAGSIVVSTNTAPTAAFTVDSTRAAEGIFSRPVPRAPRPHAK